MDSVDYKDKVLGENQEAILKRMGLVKEAYVAAGWETESEKDSDSEVSYSLPSTDEYMGEKKDSRQNSPQTGEAGRDSRQNSPDARDAGGGSTQSPLDYVLEKQQMEPYDITDDLE